MTKNGLSTTGKVLAAVVSAVLYWYAPMFGTGLFFWHLRGSYLGSP